VFQVIEQSAAKAPKKLRAQRHRTDPDFKILCS